MKWFLCAAFSVLLLAVNLVNAVQNQEFRERAEIYSRLVDCDYYKADEYNYTHFVELSALKDAEPTGYLVRVPVYVLGPRDGHIILSTTNTPNRTTDFVYEILLGGWGNSRVLIRKRIQNYSLKDLEVSSVINELRPVKVVLEISKSGHIKVFADNKPEPLITAYDPNPLPIKYLSFASFGGASVEYLYNCVSDKTAVLSGNDIRKEPAVSASTGLSNVPLDDLVQKCKFEEKWEHLYNKFHLLSEIKNSRVDGYLFKLDLLVAGSKDVHILLTANQNADVEKEAAYEIIIGGWGNTRQVIHRTQGEELFEKVQLPELLSEEKQTRVRVQMTNSGLIQVYVGDLQYKPIVWAVDKKPIPVKYVSFASNDGSRVLFFYNCDDNTSDTIDLATAPVHPLLAAPSVYDEEILASKCKHVHAWENKYTLGVNLAALKKSQPDEYVFQIPIYIRGIRDAHILLTPSGDLNPENGYEILLGGWGNTRTLIRKKTVVLAEVNEFNILDENKPIKVVVELTKSGTLRVFTDFNKSRPLLEVKDAEPITGINTLSFTAYYRDLDFYFGCSV